MESNKFEGASFSHERLSNIEIFTNPDFPHVHYVSCIKDGESYIVGVGKSSATVLNLSIPENMEIIQNNIKVESLSQEKFKELTDLAEIEINSSNEEMPDTTYAG